MDDFDLRDLLAPPLRYHTPPAEQHKPDHSPTGDPMVLAMAYVPPQKWQELYEPAEGFTRGTIFRQLDLPFKGGTDR